MNKGISNRDPLLKWLMFVAASTRKLFWSKSEHLYNQQRQRMNLLRKLPHDVARNDTDDHAADDIGWIMNTHINSSKNRDYRDNCKCLTNSLLLFSLGASRKTKAPKSMVTWKRCICVCGTSSVYVPFGKTVNGRERYQMKWEMTTFMTSASTPDKPAITSGSSFLRFDCCKQ